MLVSLLDMLLIPLQEYQQYLTGNVTECQVGKCHWGRTGGWPQTSPLRWNKYASVVLLRQAFFFFPGHDFSILRGAIHFHSNRGAKKAEDGPGRDKWTHQSRRAGTWQRPTSIPCHFHHPFGNCWLALSDLAPYTRSVRQILKGAGAVSLNYILVKHLQMKAYITRWVTLLMRHSQQLRSRVLWRGERADEYSAPSPSQAL